MSGYVLFVLIILLFILLSYFFKSKFFEYLALIFIIVFSATRFEVGYDYLIYKSFYVDFIPDSVEWLFKEVIYFLQLLGLDYRAYFSVFSIATVFTIYFAICKFTPYRKTALLIFVLIPGLYVNSFSIIRQSIALAFFMVASYYWFFDREKKARIIIFSLLSVSFHLTAAIPFIFIFVFKGQLHKRLKLEVYVFAILSSVAFAYIGGPQFLLQFLSGHYALYTNFLTQISLIKILVLNLFSFFALYLITLSKNNKAENVIYFNLFIVGVLITNAFSAFAPVTRLGYYFVVYQIFFISNLTNDMRISNLNGYYNKLGCFFIVFFYYLAMFFYSLYKDVGFDVYPKMTPYNSWLLNLF